MVVWTKFAECGTSLLPQGCVLDQYTRAAMESHINTAVEETNTVFANSGVDAQLNLVHMYRDDDFNENINGDSSDFIRAQNAIKNTNDGNFDSVHSERETVSRLLVKICILTHSMFESFHQTDLSLYHICVHHISAWGRCCGSHY